MMFGRKRLRDLMTDSQKRTEDEWAIELLAHRVNKMSREEQLAWAESQNEQTKEKVRNLMRGMRNEIR